MSFCSQVYKASFLCQSPDQRLYTGSLLGASLLPSAFWHQSKSSAPSMPAFCAIAETVACLPEITFWMLTCFLKCKVSFGVFLKGLERIIQLPNLQEPLTSLGLLLFQRPRPVMACLQGRFFKLREVFSKTNSWCAYYIDPSFKGTAPYFSLGRSMQVFQESPRPANWCLVKFSDRIHGVIFNPY